MRRANVDLGDAWLAATAAEAGEPMATFEEDLTAFTDVTRHAW